MISKPCCRGVYDLQVASLLLGYDSIKAKMNSVLSTPAASRTLPEMASMISRKQFLKHLLYRGFHAVSDLTGPGEVGVSDQEQPGHGFDLPATELSPALLAMEAELRGKDAGGDGTEDLRREIYQELAKNGRAPG
jgi:hypothetical protein